MKYFMSSSIGPRNSNMVHERHNCIIGSKYECLRFPSGGTHKVVTFSLSRSFSFISPGQSFDGPTLLKHCTLCVNTEYYAFLSTTGLNGRPVCMVRDDWYVTSSLFPHPLLKSHILRKAADPSFAFPPAQNRFGVRSDNSKSGVFTLIRSGHIFSLLCLQELRLCVM